MMEDIGRGVSHKTKAVELYLKINLYSYLHRRVLILSPTNRF